MTIHNMVYPKIGDKTVRIAATWVVSIVGIRCNTSRNTSEEFKRLIISLCISQETSKGAGEFELLSSVTGAIASVAGSQPRRSGAGQFELLICNGSDRIRGRFLRNRWGKSGTLETSIYFHP